MLITSVNNNKIKELVKLKDKKYRDKVSLFFVEGLDIIEEAYKKGYLIELYILEGSDILYEDIPYTYVSYEVMKKISDMDSVSRYYGVCKYLDENTLGDKIIILDNIQDPGNLGTIIRSAVAFNFDTVMISNDSVSVYNPKVIRATKGMLFNKNIITCDIDDFISKNKEYLIIGTDVNNGSDIKNIDIPDKIAIVIGNEGRGIRDSVRDKCDKFVYIKMNNDCESLNAGVSASILMYEVMNR